MAYLRHTGSTPCFDALSSIFLDFHWTRKVPIGERLSGDYLSLGSFFPFWSTACTTFLYHLDRPDFALWCRQQAPASHPIPL